MSRPTQIASMRLKQKWHAIIATAGTARRRMTGRSGPRVSEPAGRATVVMEAEATEAGGGGSTREGCRPSGRTPQARLGATRSALTTRDLTLETRHVLSHESGNLVVHGRRPEPLDACRGGRSNGRVDPRDELKQHHARLVPRHAHRIRNTLPVAALNGSDVPGSTEFHGEQSCQAGIHLRAHEIVVRSESQAFCEVQKRQVLRV